MKISQLLITIVAYNLPLRLSVSLTVPY